jgi:ribosome-associated toxin RatA of RatAB toxin-antitoxin module
MTFTSRSRLNAKRLISGGIVCAILLLVPVTAALAQGQPQTQIVPDPSGKGGRIRANILIPAPLPVVWNVMVDCQGAPRFVPGLRSCAVESSAPDGSSDVRLHRIAWLSGFPLVSIRFASRYRTNRQIRFERISGDIEEMQGEWTLEPRNNGASTLLSYEAYLVPSRLLPSGLVRSALKRDTPKILEAVRLEAITRRGAPE